MGNMAVEERLSACLEGALDMHRRSALVLAGAALVVSAAGSDSLSAYRWRKRIVLAFAPTPDDPRLARQRGELETLTRRADDRDLV